MDLVKNCRLSSSRLVFMLTAHLQHWKPTGIVGERAFKAIEDEPALLPRFNLAAHLDQVALTHLFGEDNVVAGVHVVTRWLDMWAQVKLLFPDGQVARHGPSLWQRGKKICRQHSSISNTAVQTVLHIHLRWNPQHRPTWQIIRRLWACEIAFVLHKNKWIKRS